MKKPGPDGRHAIAESTTIIKVDRCLHARIASFEATGHPIKAFWCKQREPFIVAAIIQHARLAKQERRYIDVGANLTGTAS